MASDTNTLATQQEIQQFIQQARNLSSTVKPPKLIGSTNVPVISKLEVSSLGDNFMGTEFLLQWLDLPAASNIEAYAVYAKRQNDLEEPKVVASVNRSPARVRIGGDVSSPVTFWVQTRLQSGYVSPRNLSPTATAVATQAQIDGDDITSLSVTKLITGNATFTGTTTFTAGSNVLTIGSSTIDLFDGTRRIGIASNAISLTDGTASVVVNSSGNIVLTKGTHVLTIDSTSIVLSDGTASIALNSSGNIILSKGTNNLTITSASLVLTDGTREVSLSSSGAALRYTAGRYIQLDGTQITLTDGTGSLSMTGTFARFQRGTFKLDLSATYVEITDGTNYTRVTATQQIMNGGQLILNGTSGAEVCKIQLSGSDKFRVNSGGDMQFLDDVIFNPAVNVEHGDGSISRVWNSTASAFNSYVPFEVVNSSDAFKHAGNTGLTGTRTALDSGSVSRTVTISGGIITGWTT